MKKIKVIGFMIAVLTLCAVLLVNTTEASAATVASGKWRDLSWTLDSTGTLTISGTGEMYSASSSSYYGWYTYRSSVKNLVIQQGVTSIGNYAFDYFQNLSSVIIPNSVTTIGMYAFRNCTQLKTVTLPSNLQTIGKRAFDSSGLTSIVIPNSVTFLEEGAFIYCHGLTSADIGIGVTVIPVDAFYYCTSLKTVNIPYSVTRIEKSAFSWCSLTSLTIPNSVTYLGKYVFSSNSYLTTLSIPASVETIDPLAFSSCKLLKGIWVDNNNANYSSDAYGVLFDKNKETLICAPGGMTGSYEIPESVTALSENAFYSCTGLTSIHIPDSVQSIGETAFYDCTSLATTTYGNAKYIGNSNNPYMILLSATSTGITSCSFHPQTRFVESYAFSSCTALKSVILHDALVSISDYAFSRCTALQSVTYCGTEAHWSAIIAENNEYLTNAPRTYHGTLAAEATCTTPAVCTICGKVAVAALGHIGSWIELVPVSCDADGINARICETCGETEIETIPAAGHIYSAVVTAPTCTQQGFTTKDCIICGNHVVTDYVAATGHSYTETITQPTCTEAGSKVSTCSICGHSETEAISAKGHGWSTWVTTVKATCTKEGSQMRFCTCGTKESATIAKLGHSYVDGVCTTCGTAMSGYVILQNHTLLTGLTLTEDLYIDLNGFDLSGTIITNGFKVYGMDRTTDGYTHEHVGLFSCVDENGKAIVPVEQFKSDITGAVRRYMAIEAQGGYTFHRIYLAITKVTIRPDKTGFGYKAVFYGDDQVLNQLDSFGFKLQLDGQTKVLTTAMDATKLEMGKEYSLLLQNFNVEAFGATDIHAEVFLKLKNGTEIESTTASYSMKTVLQLLCESLDAISSAQLQALKTMCLPFKEIMSDWLIDELLK